MTETILTLLTDFGSDEIYAGVMKGVIWSIHPGARVVDVTHEAPPHDIRSAAFLLASYAPWYPNGTVHVAVVDPGVGTARRAVAARGGGHTVVCPDNGLLTLWLNGLKEPARIHELTAPEYRLSPVSATFHGRDIFAPAAAHLARGAALESLGPAVDDPVRLADLEPEPLENGARGVVAHVDRFGNLITNLRAGLLEGAGALKIAVNVKGCWIRGIRRTYGEAEPGELIAYVGSSGFIEIAMTQGSAALSLSASLGTPVQVLFLSS